ncbi:cytochrome P450 [Brevibacterium linens]|uniref:cytochrome P450 n=1 Tax=Brevibacterium linens TaxID=1703 RepID=UPI0035151A91
MTTTAVDPAVSGQGRPIPVLDDDPFSRETLENPLPFQERLREAGPVVYLSKYNAYAIGRFDNLSEAVSNWQGFMSGRGVGLEKPWHARGLLQMDPPEHDMPREVLQEILSARVLRSMTDQCMERAGTLIDELLAGKDSGDVVDVDAFGDIGSVFPVNFFPDASGIKEEGREKLVEYADYIFNQVGPRNELAAESKCPAAEMTAWANAKCQRENLNEEGFGADIWSAADRGEILHDFAPLLTRSLVTAGVDTTVYGISSLLYGLATNPEQWEALRANPGLKRVAFDEALRWESPVQQMFRETSEDTDVEGFIIPAESRVMMCFGAANRDPRRWDNPEKFDLSRDPSGHLAFGMGIHQCVGQHAARLQATCLLEQLIPKVSKIEVACEHGVRRHHNNALRGWASIPLRFTLA